MSRINSPKHSSHHILAKEKWWSNQKNNLVELKHSTHQSLHTLFWNEYLPEKIRKLIWIEYTALKSSVVARLLAVLEEIGDDPYDIYKEQVFKSKDNK